jgi:SAM-dependent methyltransferase
MENSKSNIKTFDNWEPSIYNVNWDPKAFVEEYYTAAVLANPGYEFFHVNMIKILDQHSEKIQGKQRVLEFGGGPCLWASFFLAQYFDEIWFCDYAPSNLQFVQDWLDEQPNAYDWKPYFNCLLDIKQGHHEDAAEYETQLRSALRKGKIFQCDVNKSNLLCLNEHESNQTFDMIFTSACLEAACSTYDIFEQTICRLGDLLKPDGILLIFTYRNASSYDCNGHTFPDLRQYSTTLKYNINRRQWTFQCMSSSI